MENEVKNNLEKIEKEISENSNKILTDVENVQLIMNFFTSTLIGFDITLKNENSDIHLVYYHESGICQLIEKSDNKTNKKEVKKEICEELIWDLTE